MAKYVTRNNSLFHKGITQIQSLHRLVKLHDDDADADGGSDDDGGD